MALSSTFRTARSRPTGSTRTGVRSCPVTSRSYGAMPGAVAHGPSRALERSTTATSSWSSSELRSSRPIHWASLDDLHERCLHVRWQALGGDDAVHQERHGRERLAQVVPKAARCRALPALDRAPARSVCVVRYPSDAVADHGLTPPESWDHPRGALPPNCSRDTVYDQVVRMLTRNSLREPPPTSKLTQRHPRGPRVLRQRTYARYPRRTNRGAAGPFPPLVTASGDPCPAGLPLAMPLTCSDPRPPVRRAPRPGHSGPEHLPPPWSDTCVVSGRRRKSCDAWESRAQVLQREDVISARGARSAPSDTWRAESREPRPGRAIRLHGILSATRIGRIPNVGYVHHRSSRRHDVRPDIPEAARGLVQVTLLVGAPDGSGSLADTTRK